MDLDKEIMRRLKVEVFALEAAMSQKDAEILRLKEENKRLLIASTLTYGKMVAPGTIDMVVSVGNFGTTTAYAVDIVERPENKQCTIRVRRA